MKNEESTSPFDTRKKTPQHVMISAIAGIIVGTILILVIVGKPLCVEPDQEFDPALFPTMLTE